MKWTTACPDWERRIVARESLVPVAPLFPDEAEAALNILRDLKLRDAGGATFGELSRPWITDFAAAIFGAYDHKQGRRLIQEFFLLISKKNGKSTTAAGIMLTALLRNWREDAEFLILAPTVESAVNAYRPAASMVRQDEELSDLLDVRDYQRTIRHKGTQATLKVIAADSETVSGSKATGVLIDELWGFGKRANADSMLVEATGGLASRKEGFVIYLSTQSDSQPAGVFKQKLDYARAVRDGRVSDPKFMPVLYEFPDRLLDEEKYKDPAYFYVTNPNLGASVDEQFIARKLELGLQGVESLEDVLAKHLNVEIGTRIRTDGWAGAEFWEQQGSSGLTFAEILRRCEVLTAGVDFGGVDDWLALSIVGRERETGNWLHWAHAWAHPIAFERRKSEAPRWRDFVADGDLTIVENIGDEVAAVVALIMQCEEAGLLERIGVDRYKIQEIFEALVQAGIAAERIVGIEQGWKLIGAIAATERRLAAGKLHHCASRMMAYCVGNAKVELKGNNIVITKAVAGAAKIDPLMATFNAVSLMALNPEAAQKKHEVLFF